MINKIKNLLCLGLTLAVLIISATYVEAISQRIPSQASTDETNSLQIENNNEQPAVNLQPTLQEDNIHPVSDSINQNTIPVQRYSQLQISGETFISKTNPRINLSLRNSDVQQVLRMFADKAGLNIIFHNSARGSVTMDLVNVPINDAFKYVVQITGLSYYIDEKTIVVYSVNTPIPAGRNVLTTIPVKYIEAAAIADFLNKNIFYKNSSGLSNSDIVVTNPVSNELLVFGTQSDVLMVEKIVEKFDIKPISTTFTLNHTTPKEMATLLCNSFLLTSPDTKFINVPVSNQIAKMALKENVLACNIRNQAVSTQFASMNMNNLLITYFSKKGTLNVLGGSPQQIESIKEFIQKHDVGEPQVYLEISVLEFNTSKRKNFVEAFNTYSKCIEKNSVQCVQLKNQDYPIFITNNISENNKSGSLSCFVNYLTKNKKAKLIATPRIVAYNAKPAVIEMTSDYVQSKTKNCFNIKNDKGIKIEITPLINPNGYITMDVKPQYASEQCKTKSGRSYATLLQRRNLDLKNVRVKDGETLILSGLTKDYNCKRNTIFKKQSELLIMITPKILNEQD